MICHAITCWQVSKTGACLVELVGMVKHLQRPRRVNVLVHVDDRGHLVRASPVHMVLHQSQGKVTSLGCVRS